MLATRNRQPELMDQPDLDPRVHAQALAGLRRINAWSGSARILWPGVASLARKLDRPLRLLDLATGAGDVPLRLWQRARKAGLAIRILACDQSNVGLELARRQATAWQADIEFFQANVLKDDLPNDCDVVTSSLFLHHLDEPAAVHLLKRMGRLARQRVLVNDLVRSRTGYALAWVGTRLLSRSPIVHVDGPLSVAGAFTCREALALAKQAGLHGATVRTRWPCRFLLTWDRE